MRPQVWIDANSELSQLSARGYDDAVQGRTGIDAFDFWVTELRSTGYLHNHARMWFASIWIHTLKLPWKLGARFFFDHLLDADSAVNTLSWRWVAGLQTRGKFYMASQENIRKYSGGRFAPEGLAARPLEVEDTVDSLTAVDMEILPSVQERPNAMWVLFPDDVSVHRSIELSNSPVLILHPSLAYEWPSPVVQAFDERVVADLQKILPQASVLRDREGLVAG